MLKEGEVKCFKCDGSGVYNYNTCPYCIGKGYVDWITNAMPRRRLLTATFSSTSEHIDFNYELMNIVGERIAREVDKEILKNLSDPSSLKKYETYFPRKGEKKI